MDRSISIVILAGSRPGPDPLLAGTGLSTKALLPVGGEPMLAHPLRAALSHPAVATVVLLAQDPEQLRPALPQSLSPEAPSVRLVASGSGISQSLLDLIDGGAIAYPFIITTADHVLLTPSMIDELIAGADGADVAVGMVERRTLLAAYPGNRRTWLRFRGGAWSGANLFWIGGPAARQAIAFWRGVEQDRKKGRKIIAAFGPMLLLGAALRLLSLPQALSRAGHRLGLTARLVSLTDPEACIDADKPDDIQLIEQILDQRRLAAD